MRSLPDGRYNKVLVTKRGSPRLIDASASKTGEPIQLEASAASFLSAWFGLVDPSLDTCQGVTKGG